MYRYIYRGFIPIHFDINNTEMCMMAKYSKLIYLCLNLKKHLWTADLLIQCFSLLKTKLFMNLKWNYWKCNLMRLMKVTDNLLVPLRKCFFFSLVCSSEWIYTFFYFDVVMLTHMKSFIKMKSFSNGINQRCLFCYATICFFFFICKGQLAMSIDIGPQCN